MPDKHHHETNRISWNAATEAHNSHKGDQAAFFRAGGSTLYPDEIELLGDLSGKTLVHLQCNAGQDTLSLARLAAVVTGVDISDTAIAFARQLSADSGLPATFHRSDVYDWLNSTAERFDCAFVSYGALCWLSDLKAWGRGVARVLNPGGRLVLLDFHPVYNLFEEGWKLTYDYMGGTAVHFEIGIGDYVEMTYESASDVPFEYQEGIKNFQNPNPSVEFTWGVADIVCALLEAGLQLTTLREYPYSNGFKRFADMREIPGRRYIMPQGLPQIPMMLGVVAQKPA
ncbi:MAG: class I SAM-dependent methyltransferase [Anaerolineae bacterium]